MSHPFQKLANPRKAHSDGLSACVASNFEALSLIARLLTFPDSVFGSDSQNSTSLGTMKSSSLDEQ
jgi:hypothetical protein